MIATACHTCQFPRYHFVVQKRNHILREASPDEDFAYGHLKPFQENKSPKFDLTVGATVFPQCPHFPIE